LVTPDTYHSPLSIDVFLPHVNNNLNCENSYSIGYDEIPEMIIKICGQCLIKLLVHIFNLSFQSGTFLDMLKLSKVIAIPKSGHVKDMSNYRPVFSKILEKIMCKRLNSFISRNNILSNVQFGFSQGKSTEFACHTLNNIQEAMENKHQVVGLFLDLTKAYDVLNHQILLDKLDICGIRGLANEWFRSYLSNRTQFVEIIRVKKYPKEININP
jgi:hypothetical protein